MLTECDPSPVINCDQLRLAKHILYVSEVVSIRKNGTNTNVILLAGTQSKEERLITIYRKKKGKNRIYYLLKFK